MISPFLLHRIAHQIIIDSIPLLGYYGSVDEKRVAHHLWWVRPIPQQAVGASRRKILVDEMINDSQLIVFLLGGYFIFILLRSLFRFRLYRSKYDYWLSGYLFDRRRRLADKILILSGWLIIYAVMAILVYILWR